MSKKILDPVAEVQSFVRDYNDDRTLAAVDRALTRATKITPMKDTQDPGLAAEFARLAGALLSLRPGDTWTATGLDNGPLVLHSRVEASFEEGTKWTLGHALSSDAARILALVANNCDAIARAIRIAEVVDGYVESGQPVAAPFCAAIIAAAEARK